MARHFFVVTGIGLALVTLMFLFPALRAGAEAVGALLGPSSERDAPAVKVAALPPAGADRLALPGALTFTARSSLGFPLQVVELRSGGEPWVEQRLDGSGQWSQRVNPTLEVRAPGHWPARANPGTREFVLEPQFALVLRTPPGLADALVLRESGESPADADPSQFEFGASNGGASLGIAGTTDERAGDLPARVTYALETPYPVSIQLALSVTGDERHELDLEELVPPESMRELRVVARCAHPEEILRLTITPEIPPAVERRTLPWGHVRVKRGEWRGEIEGRVGTPLTVTSIREAVFVHARCGRGCHDRVQVVQGSEDRNVELELAPGHVIVGRLLIPPLDTLFQGSALIHCGFTNEQGRRNPDWDPSWSSTVEVPIDRKGYFELALPGRGLGPVFEPRTLPRRLRLQVSVPGYHSKHVWLTTDPVSLSPVHTFQLRVREPQFVLASGHGLAPEDVELEALRAADLDSTILESAIMKDGRLLLFCLPSRSFMSKRSRARYDDVEAFILRNDGRPIAFERGTSGEFLRRPTRSTTLRLSCAAFPYGGGSRVLLGWTWRGLSCYTYAIERRRVGTEWEVELNVPSDATSLWWSAGLEPAEEPNAFGGSVPYTRDLERLTIR